MLGKAIRMERIMDRNSHKTVIIPMDHGVTVGPIEGLGDMRGAVAKVVAGGANAVLMHKGVPRFCHRGSGKDVGLIIHLSAGTVLSPDPNVKELVCTVEEALKIGADAVSVHINLGAETESAMLKQLGEVGSKCSEWQMPLLAMMYTRGPKVENEFDVKYVKHAARVGAELGADIVKVAYTGSVESFGEVVEGCPMPVVIAGGEKVSNDAEMLRMVHEALEAGAAGVSIGRNAFGHERPTQIVEAMSRIVHDGASVAEAMSCLKGGQGV
ncbi:MAG: class I fructose-bisphosphate aldolase family protein [Phycisphaerales bacterium]|nr:MAG: class I fructose-bisphosphate aldolase family protein [Phycisphaerales bacterium]